MEIRKIQKRLTAKVKLSDAMNQFIKDGGMFL
jgi:hypothetical protein